MSRYNLQSRMTEVLTASWQRLISFSPVLNCLSLSNLAFHFPALSVMSVACDALGVRQSHCSDWFETGHGMVVVHRLRTEMLWCRI